MSNIITDRVTVSRNESIVVFLIGMRVNRWWKVHKWLPILLAMPRMLRELARRPESGLLGATTHGTTMVQYWESTEKLIAYAKDRTGAHYPAWAAFYKAVGTNGDVGIWHETYAVPAGSYECIYVNMPRTGLGQIGELVPARGHRNHARARLGQAAPATQ
jgi:Domain of unknown function (DUF4188)